MSKVMNNTVVAIKCTVTSPNRKHPLRVVKSLTLFGSYLPSIKNCAFG